MTNHHEDNASTQADVPHAGRAPQKNKKALTRLSAEEIARRKDRQRPAIARNRAAGTATPAPAAEGMTAEETAGPSQGPDRSGTTTTSTPSPDASELQRAARTLGAQSRLLAGPRQMTLWENAEDTDVIAGWVRASTRADAASRTAGADDNRVTVAKNGRVVSHPGVLRKVAAAGSGGAEPAARYANVCNIETRHDDLYLVQKVRPAVVDLVLEHRFVSEETDRRLTTLGIRFGVWSLTRSSDAEFDPYRDLTEDRIRAFVQAAGAHLSEGSRDTYAGALRRLAAGPTNRHTGARRKAVPPIPKRVEDGLWAAADAFHPDSWQHQEAKTLLALTFGAGAMPAEANLAAPSDVIADGTGEGDCCTNR